MVVPAGMFHLQKGSPAIRGIGSGVFQAEHYGVPIQLYEAAGRPMAADSVDQVAQDGPGTGLGTHGVAERRL